MADDFLIDELRKRVAESPAAFSYSVAMALRGLGCQLHFSLNSALLSKSGADNSSKGRM